MAKLGTAGANYTKWLGIHSAVIYSIGCRNYGGGVLSWLWQPAFYRQLYGIICTGGRRYGIGISYLDKGRTTGRTFISTCGRTYSQ